MNGKTSSIESFTKEKNKMIFNKNIVNFNSNNNKRKSQPNTVLCYDKNFKIKSFSSGDFFLKKNINYIDDNTQMSKNKEQISNQEKKEEKRKGINILSDAFPSGLQKKLFKIINEDINNRDIQTSEYYEIAEIHKVINENSMTKFDDDMIYYKKIPLSFLCELKILHDEWFPIDYKYDYFLKYLSGKKKSYFSLGAFTKIKEKEYLIGR